MKHIWVGTLVGVLGAAAALGLAATAHTPASWETALAGRAMAAADWSGWAAAALMVSTFASREARVMRPLAVAANVAFIGYGALGHLAPVLALHSLLLPINLWRWAQCTALRLPRRA
jgi:ribosome biogenesis protein Tsr3